MSLLERWQKHAFVHLGWIIFNLVVLIVILLSFRFGPNDNVKDILNFAISFSSLILAIFAIGQSLIAGGALPDAVASVRAGIADVRVAADKLSDSASAIGGFSQNIETKASTLAENVHMLIGRQNSGDSRSELPDPNKDIDLSIKMLQSASAVFLSALYVTILSNRTKKDYISEELTGDWITASNIIGVITALSNLNIIQTVDDEVSDSRYVTNFGKIAWIEDNEEAIIERLKKIDPTYSSVINKINKYFRS